MSKRFTGIICIKTLIQTITQGFMEQTIIHSYQLKALYNMNYSTKAPPDFVNASPNQMTQLIDFNMRYMMAQKSDEVGTLWCFFVCE